MLLLLLSCRCCFGWIVNLAVDFVLYGVVVVVVVFVVGARGIGDGARLGAGLVVGRGSHAVVVGVGAVAVALFELGVVVSVVVNVCTVGVASLIVCVCC